MSIGTGLVFVGGLFQLASSCSGSHSSTRQLPRWNLAVVGCLTLFFWFLLAGLWSEDKGRWLNHVRVELPLLLVPLGAVIGGVPAVQYRKWVWRVFLITIGLVAAATAINYILHYDAINESVLHSKPFPIKTLTSDLSHIYFGVMLAFASLLSIHFAFQPQASRRARYTYFGLGVVFALLLHVFSIRTGLAAWYVGGGFMLGRMVWLRADLRKWGLLLLICGLLVPVGAYYGSTSFRNRIENTQKDLQMWQKKGSDLSHWSAARRFVVWQLSYELWREHPILGIGPGDMSKELYDAHENIDYHIAPEHRVVDPHNQYFSWLAGSGLVGFLLACGVLLSVCFPRFRPTETAFWCLWPVLLTGFLFESMAERQVGITFWMWAWMLCFLPEIPEEELEELKKEKYTANE